MIFNQWKVKVIGNVNDLQSLESESNWRCE